MKKLWGGRFTKETHGVVEDFHSSIRFDQRLYRHDIRGSIAHAEMLGACGIVSPAEAQAMVAGLQDLLRDIDEGKVEFDPGAEDIHLNLERLLTDRIGSAGKKLHTARSRNDQVALDTRLYLKEEMYLLAGQLEELISLLLSLGEKHRGTIMPGYTHLQKAQAVTLGHHLAAYVQMFLRDLERLADCYRRTDVLPLGSGALAGTTFPIDRSLMARRLGFSRISRNSLDAVSDRDFILEFLGAASLIMMHLSRFCEELILWSTEEFGLVEMDDAFSTGSSIMPQKKNPDVAELVRGKTGRVYGHLMGLLTMMKSLPLAYNKDMQEDKEALFDTVDTVKGCLAVFIPLLQTLTFKEDRLRQAARGGFTAATDVADYLARQGVPFREAHQIVGHLVLHCLEGGKDLYQLTLEEYRRFSPAFQEDIFTAIELEQVVERRNLPGGPAPEAVARSIEESRAELETLKKTPLFTQEGSSVASLIPAKE